MDWKSSFPQQLQGRRSQNQQHLMAVKLEEQIPMLQMNDQQSERKCFANFFYPNYSKSSLQNSYRQKEDDYSDVEVNDLVVEPKLNSKTLVKINRYFEEFQIIKEKNADKYNAILNFLQFYVKLKQQVKHFRVQPYSSITFYALRGSLHQDINKLSRAVKKMYEQMIKCHEMEEMKQSLNNPLFYKHKNIGEHKLKEFLIIPRFLISQEKIIDFITNDAIRQNFQFLIVNLCLGHYNNEANKKLPTDAVMGLIRALLARENGKQIYAKISSINHGNKFKNYDAEAYQLLYKQNLAKVEGYSNLKKKKASLQKLSEVVKADASIKTRDQTEQNSVKVENDQEQPRVVGSKLKINRILSMGENRVRTRVRRVATMDYNQAQEPLDYVSIFPNIMWIPHPMQYPFGFSLNNQ